MPIKDGSSHPTVYAKAKVIPLPASEIQTTFDNTKSVRKVKALTERQRQVLALLDQGVLQSGISRRLNITPPRVFQIKKVLEKRGLIKSKTVQIDLSHRRYTQYFDVVPEAKIQGIQLTPYRAHNFRKKFRIISQSGDCVLDKRAGYNKSKKMRGPLRHVFWFPSKDSLPSVTVEWHIKTLVVYVDRGQEIRAESKAKSKEIGWYSILKAKDRFVEGQRKYGNEMQIEEVGEEISEVHAGLTLHENGPIAKEEPTIPGLWIDKSVQKELGPGFYELEGRIDHPILTQAEQGLMAAARIESQLPEAMRQFQEQFGPLTQEIHTVMAYIQSGQTVQNQINQLTTLVAQLIKDNRELRERINSNK